MRRELLIGCGSRREKRIALEGREAWEGLTTLDMNKDHKPDQVWDLRNIPLPFRADEFDEIHAYDVLEHIGAQGDWRWFFDQWSDFYRILKPDGLFVGISPGPTSPWRWGDPGHTRIISEECFVFLDQTEYTKQIGKTPMTDYRFAYKADFERMHVQTDQRGMLTFVLQAKKPARIV